MGTFIAITLGAAFGSFFGNVAVFTWIGHMARQAEKKQLEEMQKVQAQYRTLLARETERMKNYAKMEG
jgi:hypothetical protein